MLTFLNPCTSSGRSPLTTPLGTDFKPKEIRVNRPTHLTGSFEWSKPHVQLRSGSYTACSCQGTSQVSLASISLHSFTSKSTQKTFLEKSQWCFKALFKLTSQGWGRTEKLCGRCEEGFIRSCLVLPGCKSFSFFPKRFLFDPVSSGCESFRASNVEFTNQPGLCNLNSDPTSSSGGSWSHWQSRILLYA